MGKIKHSLKADAVANLYRAALFLAQGDTQGGLDFLQKATKLLGTKEMPSLQPLLQDRQSLLKSHSQKLFWAEQILDEYQRLRWKVFNQPQN